MKRKNIIPDAYLRAFDNWQKAKIGMIRAAEALRELADEAGETEQRDRCLADAEAIERARKDWQDLFPSWSLAMPNRDRVTCA